MQDGGRGKVAKNGLRQTHVTFMTPHSQSSRDRRRLYLPIHDTTNASSSYPKCDVSNLRRLLGQWLNSRHQKH